MRVAALAGIATAAGIAVLAIVAAPAGSVDAGGSASSNACPPAGSSGGEAPAPAGALAAAGLDPRAPGKEAFVVRDLGGQRLCLDAGHGADTVRDAWRSLLDEGGCRTIETLVYDRDTMGP